mmetsp:Transcript_78846/g.244749  ORF Transcript_78846/g.244749 Transcript_78846/m.244749 type:complete len:85 (-) Transcript_78846:1092-1346(-)
MQVLNSRRPSLLAAHTLCLPKKDLAVTPIHAHLTDADHQVHYGSQLEDGVGCRNASCRRPLSAEGQSPWCNMQPDTQISPDRAK